MRSDPHESCRGGDAAIWNQGGEAGVNRHEDLNEKCSQYIIANFISASPRSRRNDHPFTASDLRTYDLIELFSDCLLPLLSELMEMVRSVDGTDGIAGIWQIHIASNAPTLVARGLIATLYRKGVAAGLFVLGDLSIDEDNLAVGFALFALALISMALGAFGQSRDLERSLSLCLSPTQRLLLWMSGRWFASVVISISYLDFPRRELLFRVASSRPRAIYTSTAGGRG